MSKKVVIIGAPRSGTNMLRDVLCRLNGFATWPCDEINYIWRHGNVNEPTDELNPCLATPHVKTYIRKSFDLVSRRYNSSFVVEKTCANSLRVPFVDTVLPEAHFIFIYRNPFDVVASSLQRWKAEIDIKYIARKSRFVPLVDLPIYASRYFINHFHRILHRDKRLASWGPRFTGMDEALASCTLPEVCALQWLSCVQLSESSLKSISPSRISRVAYEDFVINPRDQLKRIIGNLQLSISDHSIREAVGDVRSNSVGKGMEQLDNKSVAEINKHIASFASHFNY